MNHFTNMNSLFYNIKDATEGYTLDAVARALVKVYDPAQVRALIDALQTHRTDV